MNEDAPLYAVEPKVLCALVEETVAPFGQTRSLGFHKIVSQVHSY